MKLNEYIEKLQELQKRGYGNHDLIYGIDDEGNGFKPVLFEPNVGFFEHGEFNPDDEGRHICIN